ncbi:DUF2851 family protein [Maribacter algicola]|uniref:DUF2851 family protein n=1 Tax=Meishania litoralis TaxID=3434685 RepID=A0ACC7LP69_9FLAO
MREDLLHFIWKYKKIQLEQLATSKKEPVIIEDVGSHNLHSGPDFFNAKISIAGQLWAGNVEIHLKSSDWYAHNHEQDPHYNNVILHVVWEDDAEVYRSDNTEIPTLELQHYIPPKLLTTYQNLLDKRSYSFVNCEKNIAQIDGFIIDSWLERLYFERLERKSIWVEHLLKKSKNDWESVLFSMLLKNFGSKINAEAFMSLAQSLDFSIVRKIQNDILQLESVFFGMSHLLDDEKIVDEYCLELGKEFKYLSNKFDLQANNVQRPNFFKLRPSNFPTIRLSQLAQLYTMYQGLFMKIMEAPRLEDLYSIFEISASSYWNTHYTFGRESKKSTKRLTRNFIDLLIINTILPLKFCYARHVGKDSNDEIIAIITAIKKEENAITRNFTKHGISVKNGKDGQALIELYNEYCVQNKCLQCAVGNSLLQS